ncbi:MAG: ferritin-like domain-containing protein [Sneathiellaceae bacterium]
MARHWTLDDIPWDRFDADKVDPEILEAVKAACLVEYNSTDYVKYLHNVFSDDPAFCEAATTWGVEEAQHGEALARWVGLADPAFDFAAAVDRFRDGYRLPLDAQESVRGSRAGELIARCVVECGTSSFYSAIRDAAEEPVLKAICGKVAGDEFRHFKLFLDHFRRYQPMERLPLVRRLQVAMSRINEASDDELAMAYYCGNGLTEPYDRRRHSAAYGARAGRLYRFGHIQRATGMVLKACGLKPQGRLSKYVARASWRLIQWRGRQMARVANAPVANAEPEDLARAA